MTTIFDTSAIFLYVIVAAYQACYFLSLSNKPKRSLLLGLGALAVICHGISLCNNVLDLGFYHVASLIFWFIALLGLINTLRRPIDNLLIILFPLAAMAITASTINAPSLQRDHIINGGMLSHILSSILAYSVLTIATVQALALSLQDYQLKHHRLKGILNNLPPLQTMEIMLFELLWIGVGLLSLSILSGLIFIDDIFAQHLVHKSVLSIAAWCIFSTLLWGHWQLGWRSQTAVRWTIGGFIALMLGYFGSKFVLELIIQA